MMTNLKLKQLNPEMLKSTLKTIDLSNNRLTRLPDEICEIQSLENLLLENNLIYNLPHQFWRLKALKELVLSKNKL